ncbi:unnamed protein product [Kuraishia capsulata CBS 1993]|uniref:Fe2OG dioxygenase domain-containing protein n=1 Tax=Kuraishia capsulata CBS 1993 TaxID=1382522 RepID=W6MMU1_9ASCO|nr:uncharacterized protein KUCA_T00002283001 [Kuraishia capsulata CBS 1993]CDK26312.1 unnamed protein product [Kuraishia capsulata CBS 1993]
MPSKDTVQPAVPILNLALAADPATRPQLIKDLKHSLLNVGFFYVSNVPIEGYSQILEDVKAETHHFFDDLSMEDKLAIEMVNSPHFLGYNSFGNEITSDKVDLREQVDLATELPAPPKSTLTDFEEVWRNMEGPNQWPNSRVLPKFRPVIEGYIDKMSLFARWFIELIEEALDVPKGTFDRFFKRQAQAKLKLIRYPELERAAEIPGLPTEAAKAVPVDLQQGVGPHRDQSFITYIYQATPHVSLQIQDQFSSGKWIDVPPIPDTLVVAVGQTLEYITKEVCTATIHRVVTPEPGLGDRLSIPFFYNIDNESIKAQLALPSSLLDLRDERNKARRGESIGFQFLTAADDAVENQKPIGWTNFLNRIKSHRDVSQRWYPQMLEYVLEQMST